MPDNLLWHSITNHRKLNPARVGAGFYSVWYILSPKMKHQHPHLNVTIYLLIKHDNRKRVSLFYDQGNTWFQNYRALSSRECVFVSITCMLSCAIPWINRSSQDAMTTSWTTPITLNNQCNILQCVCLFGWCHQVVRHAVRGNLQLFLTFWCSKVK